VDARLVLAEVFFERDELEGAEEELQAALRVSSSAGMLPGVWAAEVALTRVTFSPDWGPEALRRLGLLRRLRGPNITPHPVLPALDQIEIDCRLALGDLEGARRMAGSTPPPDIPTETSVRIDLRSGRPDRALSRLTAPPSPNLAAQVRRLVLLACAQRQQGLGPRADDTMRRAVEAARPEHYVRPFLDEVVQTLPLLYSVGSSASDPYLSRLLDHGERCVPDRRPQPAAIVLEPLTGREIEVLRYLPSHLNLRQIAIVMCLSANTVKTHVKAVYRKTGATSRDDAVNIARSHGLL
jgi:DNA-binding CsgD family transcriptional regulator